MEQNNVSRMFALGQFEIPRYQRAYSWGKKQREQLIEDLRDVKGKYYFGHFLFEESGDDNTIKVIDGQQRITTLVIFYSSLYAELKKRGDQFLNDANRIRHLYITDQFTMQRRLKTVDYDDTFFLNEIIDRRNFIPEDELASASQRHIRHCREYFDSVFSKETTDVLFQWEKLLSNASITYFIVENKVDAVQIFAFSNDRGKPLSRLEVLKSFFMLQIYMQSTKQDDNIQRLYNSFAEIYREVVKVNTREDDVLRYFWMAYGNKGYYTDDYLTEIKDYCKRKGVEDIIVFTEQLSRAFQYVEKIEKDNSIEMTNLRRLDRMAQAWPLLLKAKVVASVEEKTWKRLVRLLENIIFRSLLRGGRADIESRLHQILSNFHDDSTLNKRIDIFKESMKYDYWNDSELRNALENRYIYGRRKACTYLLWRYEQCLCPDDYPNPKVAWDEIMRSESLDHIAPQHPIDGKPLATGYGEYEGENGIESGEWLHSIGNLVLMSQSQNSSIGNRDFVSIKLKSYENDNLLWQQKEIYSFVEDKEHPVWNKTAIENRGKHIISKALEIWNINEF